MLARRDILGTTGIAGILGAILPAGRADSEAGQTPERAMADIATAVADLRKSLESERSFSALAGVREQQRSFLRATSKYPDFIEVGVDVWQGIYDWHIRWHQPITIARDASGRYIMSLIVTTLVLRPDTLPGYIGTPYDNK